MVGKQNGRANGRKAEEVEGQREKRTRRQIAKRSPAIDDIREFPGVGVQAELPSIRDDGVE